MKLLYFAWLRQKIGKAEETLDVPDHVKEVGQLLDWLESGAESDPTEVAGLVWRDGEDRIRVNLGRNVGRIVAQPEIVRARVRIIHCCIAKLRPLCEPAMRLDLTRV